MPAGMTVGDTCVIGWPIAHSRSPLIHNYWIAEHGIGGRYTAVPVEPGQLPSFFSSFAERRLLGCNVTIPHKEGAAQLVALDDELTRRLGAVNTVFLRDGMLRGTNTDGYGFITNLRACAPQVRLGGGTALVLGAGGSARAVVGAMLEAGVSRILLANRTGSRALELQRLFGPALHVVSWADRAAAAADVGLLVNTTMLGMQGQEALDMSLDRLPREAVVAELVYVPLETELMKAARARDIPTADGLGMLLYQAQAAFRTWYGILPSVTPRLRELVERDLRSAGPR
jgi:shikimate dehydrogenase